MDGCIVGRMGGESREPVIIADGTAQGPRLSGAETKPNSEPGQTSWDDIGGRCQASQGAVAGHAEQEEGCLCEEKVGVDVASPLVPDIEESRTTSHVAAYDTANPDLIQWYPNEYVQTLRPLPP